MIRRLPFLLAAISGLACLAPPASAQLPERLRRCLPYPTLAEEIWDMMPAPPPEREFFLDEIHLDGDTKLPKAELEKIAADLMPSEPFAEPNWYNEVAQVARGEWQDRGYFRVEITATPKQLRHDQSSEHDAVMLHVQAGRQYRTGEIQMLPSSPDDLLAFPLDELRQLVSLQRGDIFDTSKLRAAFDNLKRRYGENGYIDFTAEPNFDVNDVDGVINLTLRLDQQKQFRVSKVTVLGLDPSLEAQLRSAVPVGEPFNYTKILEFIHDHRSKLPDWAGPRDMELQRDQKQGLASVTFDFRDCP